MQFFSTGTSQILRIIHPTISDLSDGTDLEIKLIFQLHHQSLPFSTRNSQNFEKAYKVTIVNKTLLSIIPKITDNSKAKRRSF